ncbi:ROK family transcriptional regulator [Saccharopolyspora erythraea]|uniref:ROK family transcriptional regulator n=1 Tax=Saccharopolyspora erythraea TaxID=1836 RepID=UPI001BA8D152|nr:ROK family transcriptional regulator [Saccharopolyspora erythraea]QUH02392.1 ROK family transcriptional regulator [Saccharopolyspora erythraea]
MASQSADLHRAAILALAGTAGSLSRTEIARRLDLSPASVTQLTKDLIERGLLAELAAAPSRGGRPAQLLGLAGAARHAIGVKVTPDHLAIADVRLDGTVRRVATADFDPGSADALGALADAILSFAGECEGGAGSLLGVGLGVPGGVSDRWEGVVNADILGWNGLPLGRRLRSMLGLPVLVDNDVNALAVAECLYGRGRTRQNLVIITIGVGIGAAIVSGGSVYRGAHGDAGELGHTPFELDGPRCVCGNNGCLEAVIGDRALVARARRDGILSADQGIAALHDAAAAGDAGASAILREAGRKLGRSVASLLNVIDPESVVVYGEGIAGWRYWEPGFEPALRAHLPRSRNDVPVEVDRWDDRNWTQGAAALVMSVPLDSAEAGGDPGRAVRARLVDARGEGAVASR